MLRRAYLLWESFYQSAKESAPSIWNSGWSFVVFAMKIHYQTSQEDKKCPFRVHGTDALDISTLSDKDTTELDLNFPAFKSAEYLLLITQIQENSHKLSNLCLVDGYVYKRTKYVSGDARQEASCWKICVPGELTESLIERLHDHSLWAHGEFAKTLYRLTI